MCKGLQTTMELPRIYHHAFSGAWSTTSAKIGVHQTPALLEACLEPISSIIGLLRATAPQHSDANMPEGKTKRQTHRGIDTFSGTTGCYCQKTLRSVLGSGFNNTRTKTIVKHSLTLFGRVTPIKTVHALHKVIISYRIPPKGLQRIR